LAIAASCGATAVELDPAGGVVACWLGRRDEPGLVRLAADLRRSPDACSFQAADAVEVSSGVRVITAPTSGPEAAATITSIVSTNAAEAVGPRQAPTVLDAGRWSPTQPTAARIAGCDAVVLVVAPTLTSVAHARGLVPAVANAADAPVYSMAVGTGQYGIGEVASAVGAAGVGVLPWDQRAVRLLLESGAGRGWARTSLARSARAVVVRVRANLSVAAVNHG
jgi:hypothetical protein